MRACKQRSTSGSLVLGIVLTLIPAPGAFSQTGLLSTEEITARLRMFAPATLTADTLPLAPGDRRALRHLIEAGKILERIYLRQNTPGGDTLPEHLAADTTESGILRKRYFLLGMSPWSPFDMNRAIIPGIPRRKPQQANLYPLNMLRSNWGSWFIALDPARQAEASGPYHVVRFDSAGRLTTVPYAVEYADLLSKAGARLVEAASLTSDKGLAILLKTTADAFRTNDYGASERAAMAADGPLSATMGPTSLYLDNIFRYKLAYEIIVGVRNEPATRMLREMEKQLPAIAKTLGAADSRGRRISVRMDDAAFVGGAARSGSIASTLRLPVDTSLVRDYGSRTVILRNVHQAGFEAINLPIARAMLDSPAGGLVGFEAHLAHMAMRALCSRFEPEHPWKAEQPQGWNSSSDPGPPLSSAKTDAAALIGLDLMLRNGSLASLSPGAVYATQVAALLRTLRFWGNDPGSAPAAIQFNFHREQGALVYDAAGGRVRIDIEELRQSVRALHSTIADLQARGDIERAAAFYRRYASQPPELLGLREQLSNIPIDIEPTFLLAE